MKLDANNIAREQGPAGLGQELERRVEEAPDAKPVPVEDKSCPLPAFLSVGELVRQFPQLRPAVVSKLLREGEIVNVIAPSKTGKSWLMLDLAVAVATGEKWLGLETVAGEVLILDNELHAETVASRIPRVLEARGIGLGRVAGTLHVESLRGKLRDIHALEPYFRCLEPGRFRLVILDAFYRFLPAGTDENDNGAMAAVYNQLDSYAQMILSAFGCVHHCSKGLQSGKAVVDVGAGAGAMSRAADTHLILRPHQEENAVVLEAVTRSWPPLAPICLRWEYPVWNLAPDLDPAALRKDNRKPRRNTDTPSTEPPPEPWTVERFVAECITASPELRDSVVRRGVDNELSQAEAKRLLDQALEIGLAHVWKFGGNCKQKIATRPQDRSGTLENVPAE